MRALQPMGGDDFSTAPFLFTASGMLSASAAPAFVELGDPSRWFPLMTSSAWHGRVGGVGSEREVAIRLFGRFREVMIAWEPDHRLAFSMIATTSPLISRMAEDWKLTPELGGVRLDWTVAAYPSALGRAITPVLRRILREMFRRLRPQLERRAQAHPTRAAGPPVHGTPAS